MGATVVVVGRVQVVVIICFSGGLFIAVGLNTSAYMVRVQALGSSVWTNCRPDPSLTCTLYTRMFINLRMVMLDSCRKPHLPSPLQRSTKMIVCEIIACTVICKVSSVSVVEDPK